MEQVKWEFSEEELNLSDFALFLSVMKNQKAHENVLSIIMDETDLRLRKIHVEEVVLNRQGHRAIRLNAGRKTRRTASSVRRCKMIPAAMMCEEEPVFIRDFWIRRC